MLPPVNKAVGSAVPEPGANQIDAGTCVGVVVVTRNSAEHIAPCLRALRAATTELPLRLVVVDNDSHDGTVAIASAAWAGLPVIRNLENTGFTAAVNMGASTLADCSHLLMLNPDAFLSAGSLDTLMAALNASPSAAACGPHLLYPDGRHQISARPLPTLTGTIYDALLLYHLKARPDFVEQFPPDHRLTEVDCLSGACMLIRRQAFDDLDGLDERFFLYGEDVDFCARLRGLGRTLLLVPEARVFHVQGASAFKDRSLFFQEAHRARALYARKHFGAVKAAVAISAQVVGLMARGALYVFGPWFGRPDLRPHAAHQWRAIATLLGPAPTLLGPAPTRRRCESARASRTDDSIRRSAPVGYWPGSDELRS